MEKESEKRLGIFSKHRFRGIQKFIHVQKQTFESYKSVFSYSAIREMIHLEYVKSINRKSVPNFFQFESPFYCRRFENFLFSVYCDHQKIDLERSCTKTSTDF